MNPEERSNRVVYTNDGYAVAWNEKGLQIRSIDYHAGELRLTWDNILNIFVQSTLLAAIGIGMAYLLRRQGSAVQSAIYRATLVSILACNLLQATHDL